MFKTRPPVKSIVLTWDLSLVLQMLSEAPFEPARNASLCDWTWKTTFLLAITSTARVREIQAMDTNPDLCLVNRYRASLKLNQGFVSKWCYVPYLNRSIYLQAFYPEPENDVQKAQHLLCPVTALRWYLVKTEPIRGHPQLLVSCKLGATLGTKVSKATVARWIPETICLAYERAKKPIPVHNSKNIKAHTTRAMAASLADIRGVTPMDLCAAATWSSMSVFARFYRLDLAAENVGISCEVLKAALAVE